MPPTTPQERLRWAREHRRMSIADVWRATGINQKTIQSHESGYRMKRGLSTEYSAAYSRVYDVSESWLVTGKGEPFGPKSTRGIRVPVKGVLAAGVWTESFDMPPEDQFDVWVVERPELEREVLYGAIVKGSSMNLVYPEGTIVVLRRGFDGPRDLQPGKRYHVERQLPDGRTENTLKTVKIRNDGKVWLVPESDDPEFGQALELKSEDGVHVQFIGKVVMAITYE